MDRTTKGPSDSPPTSPLPISAAGIRNLRMMRVLERVAGGFQRAGVPLMALKGAALQLTLHDQPDERVMGDLDLLIRPEDVGVATALLESLGGRRGDPLVRDDFFPRFHYEVEYTIGTIHQVKIDLHVRPFRPTRYGAVLPRDAFWKRAIPVRIGGSHVLVPCPDDMLIHLAVHAAVHGCPEGKWLADVTNWASRFGDRLDWGRFLDTLNAWHLVAPARQALARVARDGGNAIPARVMARLDEATTGWRERLALWQAPRDATHPTMHVAVNVICTPGWRFKLSYFAALMLPSEAHMADWYARRHVGWLACAHFLRWLGPLRAILPTSLRGTSKTEVRPSPRNGVGIFAVRDLAPGERIGRGLQARRGRSRARALGDPQTPPTTGALRHLNHSCRPNARFVGLDLVALRPIAGGQEITIDFGAGACRCRMEGRRSAAAAFASPRLER